MEKPRKETRLLRSIICREKEEGIKCWIEMTVWWHHWKRGMLMLVNWEQSCFLPWRVT